MILPPYNLDRRTRWRGERASRRGGGGACEPAAPGALIDGAPVWVCWPRLRRSFLFGQVVRYPWPCIAQDCSTKFLIFLVPGEGFEPPTNGLQNC
jgi:hypothetical protein